jgi:hypothetical protein
MGQQIPGMPAFHEAYRTFGDGDMFQRGVKAGVPIDLVKILNGDIVAGAFVLDNVNGTEDGGDILRDRGLSMFFYNQDINTERGGVEGDFRVELKERGELGQFELDGLKEGGMPVEEGLVCVLGLSHINLVIESITLYTALGWEALRNLRRKITFVWGKRVLLAS